MAGPGGDKARGGARVGVDKRRTHFRAHLVRRRTDARPKPCQHARAWGVHLRQSRLQHAADQPTPAGMRGADLAAVVGTQQHRQAIGGEDRQHRAWHVRHRRVGLRLLTRAQRSQFRHLRAVHLAQPARRCRQLECRRQHGAIGSHRLRHVATAQAKIEPGKRRGRHPRAVTRGHRRVDAARRRPVGVDPGLGHD
jgi:hypothetical protein